MVKVEKFLNRLSDTSKQAVRSNLEISCRKKLNFDHPKYKLNPLDELNDYCILHILSFLNLIDIINLGKTSIRMKSVTRLSYFRCLPTSFVDSSIEESELLLILEEIGNSVRSFEMPGLNTRILDCLLKNCVNVTEMKLVDPKDIFNSFSFVKYKPFLQNITSLEIRKSAFFYSKMSRVKRFQNFDALLFALTEVDALKSLKIDYIEIRDKTFKYLKSIKNLKCLHLNRYTVIENIIPITPHFDHVTDIYLSIEDSKTGEIVAELTVRN